MFGEPVQYSTDWQYVLPTDISKSLQKAIDSAKAEMVQDILINLVAWIKANVPNSLNDLHLASLETDLSGITSDYFEEPEVYENEIDICLNRFYDICDMYKIYLGLTDDETPAHPTSKAEADWILNSTIKSLLFGDSGNREYFTNEEFQEICNELRQQGYMEECDSSDDRRCFWLLNPIEGDERLEFERVDKSK